MDKKSIPCSEVSFIEVSSIRAHCTFKTVPMVYVWCAIYVYSIHWPIYSTLLGNVLNLQDLHMCIWPLMVMKWLIYPGEIIRFCERIVI